VLFDAASCIKRYTNVDEILREFYDLRLKYYVKRKDYMEGMLLAESQKLANQARFICEKIDGRIGIGNAIRTVGFKQVFDKMFDMWKIGGLFDRFWLNCTDLVVGINMCHMCFFLQCKNPFFKAYKVEQIY